MLRTGVPLLATPADLELLLAAGEVEAVGAPSLDWLGVPLKRGDKTFGVLAVQSYAESTRYTERERDILTFVSSQLASAIDRKRAEEQVRALAYHDALTGLPNRLLFNDRLALAVAQARRKGERLAVLFLDLDGFKAVNDSLGHNLGDLLLRGTADRIQASLRAVDSVARLGGDEFILLLPGIRRVEEAARVAEKVLESIRAPLAVEGHELFVTASMGISVYPEDGEDVETLVKNADTAMYRAKEQGRDRYQLYTPAMNARALERLALENSLRKALARGRAARPLPARSSTSRAAGSTGSKLSCAGRTRSEARSSRPPTSSPWRRSPVSSFPSVPSCCGAACRQARAWQRLGTPTCGWR